MVDFDNGLGTALLLAGGVIAGYLILTGASGVYYNNAEFQRRMGFMSTMNNWRPLSDQEIISLKSRNL